MKSPAVSSDEGEIVEPTSWPRSEQNGDVDRGGRHRATSSWTPEHGNPRARTPREGSVPRRSRSRSPRGSKRPRPDQRDNPHTSGSGSGPKRNSFPSSRYGVHFYDDRPSCDETRQSGRGLDRPRPPRTALPCNGDDRPPTRPSNHRHGGKSSYSWQDDCRSRDRGRDSYAKRVDRRHSRSPTWDRRNKTRRIEALPNRDRRADQIDFDSHRKESLSRQNPASLNISPVKKVRFDGKDTKHDGQGTANGQNSKGQQEPDPEPDIEFDAAPTMNNEAAVEAEIQRRKALRMAALKRAVGASGIYGNGTRTGDSAASNLGLNPQQSPVSTGHATETNTPRSDVDAPSPVIFDIGSDQELINRHGESAQREGDGPSAADYDPMADMREDERRDELRFGYAFKSQTGPEPTPSKQMKEPIKDADDDDFDMFAEDFDDAKIAAPAAPQESAVVEEQPTNGAGGGGILEEDDQEGYYKIRPGEILDGRYQITTTLGRGMFSGVARAVDVTTRELVAVKIMRNNDALRKGGFTEIAILQKLNAADREKKMHVIKFERSFDYRGHLCMVFENLSLNLREVLKKFGNNVGINLSATRAYAYQIFVALGHMKKCNIIHADLKPDNILVNETRTVLKICDLGTAIDRSDAATASTELTPYLVSRFYRAPEIILGMPYDYAVDMWSIGCTLYELYTGKILFTGDCNNQMLKTMMEIRGKLSGKLYRRGKLSEMHFDEQGNFVSVERDKTTGKTIVRPISVIKPTRDLRTRLVAASSGMNDAESRELNHFVDLLERCLTLNPDKRITPREALRHPFFTHRLHATGR